MFLPFSILFSNFAVFHAIPLKLYTIQTEDASCAPNPGITKTDLSSVKILWPRPCQSIHANTSLSSSALRRLMRVLRQSSRTLFACPSGDVQSALKHGLSHPRYARASVSASKCSLCMTLTRNATETHLPRTQTKTKCECVCFAPFRGLNMSSFNQI